MDLQDYLNFCMDYGRSLEKHLRIGTALEYLNGLDENKNIVVDMSWKEGAIKNYKGFKDKEYSESRIKEIEETHQMYLTAEFDSYRGDYAQMYIGYNFEPHKFTVKNLKDLLLDAKRVGEMEGYKGGTFSINDNTLLNIASYSNCEGILPMGFKDIDDDNVMLLTQYYED